MTISTLAQSNALLESTTGLYARKPKTSLDQNDFMKLLTVQLTHQDPLKPKEDTEFIAQMASFSSLEQMNSLVNSFTKFNSEQEWARGISLVGQSVDVLHEKKTVTGIIDAASMVEGIPMISIGGVNYPISEITAVRSVQQQPASTGSNP